jgi:hypothetical protein
VALAIAEDAIRLHTEPRVHDLPEHVCARLRDVVFHVMPRMSPDGAETVIRHGRYVRSTPRDARPHAPVPRWVRSDVDGDGLALEMRREDPTGEFVESREVPGVMVPRTLESEGPFFKVWPEGTIEHFDGTIPDPHYLSDNAIDLNRNFPYGWMPEPEQPGAGRYPTSEPEVRAVVDYTSARPHLFAWLNLHTFGGVYIRPLGTAPDTKMDPQDLAVFRQIAEWGEVYGGYPTVSGFEEFTYEPDKPLHGDLTEYAYHQLGVVAQVCELWDLFQVIGAKRGKKFVDYYSELTSEDLLRFARWDREHNHGRVFVPWRKATHPQLGEVEVGGFDMRVGMSNPPLEQIDAVCTRQSQAFLRVGAMAPALSLRHVATERLGDGAYAVEVEVRNEGYLPTYVLSSAKKLTLDARVFVDAAAGAGLEVASEPRACAGHLDGWGRGKFHQAIFFAGSSGSVSERRVRFVVKGRGALVVSASGLRVGRASITVDVGG